MVSYKKSVTGLSGFEVASPDCDPSPCLSLLKGEVITSSSTRFNAQRFARRFDFEDYAGGVT